ncbi:MAG: kinase [Turneriella sp.]
MTAADHIAAFILKTLSTHDKPHPLFIGLQGPQGCGKTTASNAAVARLQTEHNLRGVTLSIDDFYLTRGEQIMLAQQHAGNIYLSQRGYPGTHDIPLGQKTLKLLHRINQTKQPVAIPRYDKSLCDGEGDRLPENAWPRVEAPLAFVLLEGWCVGFTPVPQAEIADVHMAEVNRLLGSYSAWYEFFEAFIQLRTENITNTIGWRIEAEEKMRSQKKSAMTPERIRAYIERFLPAYKLYLPGLKRSIGIFGPALVIEIAADRGARRASFSTGSRHEANTAMPPN